MESQNFAEVYHSARCTKAACTGNPPCAPSGQENKFGCDEAGVLTIHEISSRRGPARWLALPPGRKLQMLNYRGVVTDDPFAL
jgi:hypothetical protein